MDISYLFFFLTSLCMTIFGPIHVSANDPLLLLLWLSNIPLWGFPQSSVGKEYACSAGDPGSIPGSGRSPGGGNGNPLQLPRESHRQRSLVGYSQWGCKSQTQLVTKPLPPPYHQYSIVYTYHIFFIHSPSMDI